jgi:hypothetical protein
MTPFRCTSGCTAAATTADSRSAASWAGPWCTHASIVQGELVHDGDPVLARHIAGATAKSTPRGWRLVRSTRAGQIDAAVALAIANSLRVAPRATPPAFLGWL